MSQRQENTDARLDSSNSESVKETWEEGTDTIPVNQDEITHRFCQV